MCKCNQYSCWKPALKCQFSQLTAYWHIDHDKFLLGDYNQLTSSPEKNLSWSTYIEKLTIILHSWAQVIYQLNFSFHLISSHFLAVEFQIYCQRLLCVVNQRNLLLETILNLFFLFMFADCVHQFDVDKVSRECISLLSKTYVWVSLLSFLPSLY